MDPATVVTAVVVVRGVGGVYEACRLLRMTFDAGYWICSTSYSTLGWAMGWNAQDGEKKDDAEEDKSVL